MPCVHMLLILMLPTHIPWLLTAVGNVDSMYGRTTANFAGNLETNYRLPFQAHLHQVQTDSKCCKHIICGAIAACSADRARRCGYALPALAAAVYNKFVTSYTDKSNTVT